MITIQITNEKNEKMTILIHKESTKDKLIDALYSEVHMIESKGRIELVNFLFKGRN